MKWWPAACERGDMIRVQLGSIFHYGIFVSEDEVLQFGLPPVDPRARDASEVRICATDMDTFSCGKPIEVAQLDHRERTSRFSPDETVSRARARLGEGGYDLLLNNCEHFAYECVFGMRKSVRQDAARRKWNNRPIFDVYLSLIPADLTVQPVYPPQRERELAQTTNERARLEKYAVWHALSSAVRHSFGYAMQDLSFHKAHSGKWLCDALHFSLAHTRDAVAVAVSNEPCGIDLENIDDFTARRRASDALLRKICTAQELAAQPSQDEFLTLWTKKEALYKCSPRGCFRPAAIEAAAAASFCTRTGTIPAVCLCACGKQLEHLRCYLLDNDAARAVGTDFVRNGS